MMTNTTLSRIFLTTLSERLLNQNYLTIIQGGIDPESLRQLKHQYTADSQTEVLEQV